MPQNPKSFDLYDIVLYTSAIGPKRRYVGVIVSIGHEAYRVKFYDTNSRSFGTSFAVVDSEVEWIGPMPEYAEKDL